MKKIALLVLLAFVISCAAPPAAPPAATAVPPSAAPAAPPAAATTAPQSGATAAPTLAVPTAPVPAEKGRMRINITTDIRISNIPTRMAMEALTQKGYEVEAVPIAQFSLVVPALAQGELDISTGSNVTVWSAIARGGKLRSIVGWTNNPYFLVTSVDIRECAELDGKPIGIQGFRGLIEAELADYLAKNCNNAEPTYVTLDQDDPRRAALEAGQIVGGRFELDDVLQLQQEAPGKYKPLISFGKEYPDIPISSFVVGQEFIDNNPELVQDFVTELIRAQREVQDPEVLKEQIIKYYNFDPAAAEAQAKAYLEANVWDGNGGFSEEALQKTMDFVVQNKILAKPLNIADVADFSFLNAALEELGRE